VVVVALAVPGCPQCRGTGWCVVRDDECPCTRRDQTPGAPLPSLPGCDASRLEREIGRILIAAEAPFASYSADRLSALVSDGRGPRTPEAVASYAQVSIDVAAEVFSRILVAQRRDQEQ